MRPIDDHYSFNFDREKHRRKQAFREFKRHMEAVVDAQPEWYVWVTQGQPLLSAEQYERVLKPRNTKREPGR